METVRKEKRRKRVTLEELVNLKESERFFLVKINDKIGYGVFARQNFKALDLLLDYKGEKISTQEAKRRSLFYDYENKGSFIFDGVKDGSNFVSIDATYYHKSFGRYVNDSPKQFTNAKAKRMVIGKEVKIILVATKDIEIGTEIRYDYLEGQRSINYEVMPWRAPQYEPSRPCHFDVEKEIVIVSDTGKKKQLTPSQAIKIMNQSYMVGKSFHIQKYLFCQIPVEEKEEQSEDNEEKEEQSEDNEEKEEQSEDSEEKEEQSEDNEEKEEQSEDNEEKEEQKEQSEDNEEKEEQSEDNEEIEEQSEDNEEKEEQSEDNEEKEEQSEDNEEIEEQSEDNEEKEEQSEDNEEIEEQSEDIIPPTPQKLLSRGKVKSNVNQKIESSKKNLSFNGNGKADFTIVRTVDGVIEIIDDEGNQSEEDEEKNNKKSEFLPHSQLELKGFKKIPSAYIRRQIDDYSDTIKVPTKAPDAVRKNIFTVDECFNKDFRPQASNGLKKKMKENICMENKHEFTSSSQYLSSHRSPNTSPFRSERFLPLFSMSPSPLLSRDSSVVAPIKIGMLNGTPTKNSLSLSIGHFPSRKSLFADIDEQQDNFGREFAPPISNLVVQDAVGSEYAPPISNLAVQDAVGSEYAPPNSNLVVQDAVGSEYAPPNSNLAVQDAVGSEYAPPNSNLAVQDAVGSEYAPPNSNLVVQDAVGSEYAPPNSNLAVQDAVGSEYAPPNSNLAVQDAVGSEYAPPISNLAVQDAVGSEYAPPISNLAVQDAVGSECGPGSLPFATQHVAIGSKRRREKKPCPVCGLLITELPKHMRDEHTWSTISSQKVTGLFGLRKKPSESTTKNERNRKICPFPDCMAVTKNPGEHLRSKKHDKKIHDDDYKKLLKMFKLYDPQLFKTKRKLDVNSPRKEDGVVTKRSSHR
ncbi:uncharacterized protein [Clytia hemisphaerica]|uniref:uncharacterized protein n=1 Tax=Clytia hemisphaerica TaxID=252671 RepID=UPI0034D4E0D3